MYMLAPPRHTYSVDLACFEVKSLVAERLIVIEVFSFNMDPPIKIELHITFLKYKVLPF